jgi:hypothetical protein
MTGESTSKRDLLGGISAVAGLLAAARDSAHVPTGRDMVLSPLTLHQSARALPFCGLLRIHRH